jgi:lysine 6-dehydrogenase
MTKKHALILGSGRYARKVGAILVKSPIFGRLTVASRKLDKAQILADDLSADTNDTNIQLSVNQVDASHQNSLLRLFENIDVVVNMTDPIELTAIPTVRASIESRVPYVDLNTDTESLRKVFEFDSDAKSAGVSICAGFGYDPGLVNMLAKHGMNQLDEVEEIHFAGGNQGPFARYPERGIRVVLDMHSAPYIYSNGKFVNVPAYSDIETISLPGAKITREVMAAVHAPLIMMPISFPSVKRVTYKNGISPAEWGNDIMRNFGKWGLLSTEPIETPIGQISPREFAISFLSSQSHAKAAGDTGPAFPFVSLRQVKVVGKRGADRMMYKYVCRDPGYATTENTCALAATMLARGDINATGLLFPEMVNPKPFMDAAVEGGLVINETLEKV